MTPTTGRPAIGPQITLRLPEETTTRLDVAAAHRDTTRANIIRNAIRTHLGPNPADAPEFIADANANALAWEEGEDNPMQYPSESMEAANAIAQANAVIRLHDTHWNPDLSPVWAAIAHAESENTWEDAITAFARVVRTTGNIAEWVTISVDIVTWTVKVTTGGGMSSAAPASYTWTEVPDQLHMSAMVDMAHGTTPDVWANAGRLIVGDITGYDQGPGWDLTAPAVEAATLLLVDRARLGEDVVARVVARWEDYRRYEADQGR